MQIARLKESPPLDTAMLVVTPENVAFDFQLAGPFPRVLALLIDGLVVAVLFLVIFLSLGAMAKALMGIALILWFFIWWGFGLVVETLNNGQTPGKAALSLRVVSATGLSITPAQAILRNLLRGPDLIPPFFPGVFAMMGNARFQRLGDLAANTMVIIERRNTRPTPAWPEENTSEVQALIPKKFSPSIPLMETLASYIGRRKVLSAGRRKELAGVLAAHFRKVWSLPKSVDSDLLLCAMYERAAGGSTE